MISLTVIIALTHKVMLKDVRATITLANHERVLSKEELTTKRISYISDALKAEHGEVIEGKYGYLVFTGSKNVNKSIRDKQFDNWFKVWWLKNSNRPAIHSKELIIRGPKAVFVLDITDKSGGPQYFGFFQEGNFFCKWGVYLNHPGFLDKASVVRFVMRLQPRLK